MSHKEIQNKSNAHELFPGPRAFLASGYNSEQLSILRKFLDSIGYDDAPVRACTGEQMDDTIETVLLNDTHTHNSPQNPNDLPCVFVLSGLTRNDLQNVMGQFSTNGLPRPIFAMTTPTSLGFKVRTLLEHLQEEQKSFIKNMAKKQPAPPKE